MRSPLSKLFAIAAIFFIATGAYAALGSVDLGWAENPEQDVMGYKVYFGTASGVYGESDDVSQTTASISDLTVGVRYYFAVTAYDLSGLESDYSQEVSTIVPPPPSPTPTPTPTATPTPTPTATPTPTRDSHTPYRHTHSHRHPDSNSNSDANGDSNAHSHRHSNTNRNSNTHSHRNSNSDTASGDCYSARRPNCFRRAICHL